MQTSRIVQLLFIYFYNTLEININKIEFSFSILITIMAINEIVKTPPY